MRTLWHKVRRVLYVLLAVVVFLAFLEGAARLHFVFYPEELVSFEYRNYLEMSRSLPWFADFSEASKRVRPTFVEYSLYAKAPLATPFLNFSEYHGARAVPASVPPGEASFTIWLFGGSTLENGDTSDATTIVNELAKELLPTGMKPCLWNFGVGGFQTSLELIKFQDLLRRVSSKERPDLVILYDGFNDPWQSYLGGPGSMQRDLSMKLRDLVCRESFRLATYCGSEFLGDHSALWRKYFRNKIRNNLYWEKAPPVDSGSVQKSVEIYFDNLRMVNAICHEFSIAAMFVLQPLVATKKQLSETEAVTVKKYPELVKFFQAFYSLAREKGANMGNFHDFSRIFDDTKETVFYDLGHLSPEKNAVVGKALAGHVLARFKSRSHGGAPTDSPGPTIENTKPGSGLSP